MICSGVDLKGVDSGEAPATISDLIDQYTVYGRRVRGLAEDTIDEQRLYLARFSAAQPYTSPTELFEWLNWARVQRLVFEYSEGHGPGSCQWLQFSLRSFLGFCHNRGYVSSDLSGAVPAVRSRRLSSVPKSIDDETARRLLDSIDTESAVGLRDAAIIRLLMTYGVRGIQVRQLRLEDVGWADNRIHFRAVKRGKAINQHLTPEVGNSLLAYIRGARPNSAPHAEVFLTVRPPFHPIRSSGSFSSIIARRLRQIDAELPEGVSHGAHSFRHAFATRLAGEVPLKHIADMLGHRDLSSSLIYSKVDFKALAQAAQPWPEETAR